MKRGITLLKTKEKGYCSARASRPSDAYYCVYRDLLVRLPLGNPLNFSSIELRQGYHSVNISLDVTRIKMNTSIVWMVSNYFDFGGSITRIYGEHYTDLSV